MTGRSRCAAQARLAATLAEQRPLAERFRVLATLRTDADVGTPAGWRWTGPTAEIAGWATRLGASSLLARVDRLAQARS